MSIIIFFFVLTALVTAFSLFFYIKEKSELRSVIVELEQELEGMGFFTTSKEELENDLSPSYLVQYTRGVISRVMKDKKKRAEVFVLHSRRNFSQSRLEAFFVYRMAISLPDLILEISSMSHKKLLSKQQSLLLKETEFESDYLLRSNVDLKGGNAFLTLMKLMKNNLPINVEVSGGYFYVYLDLVFVKKDNIGKQIEMVSEVANAGLTWLE